MNSGSKRKGETKETEKEGEKERERDGEVAFNSAHCVTHCVGQLPEKATPAAPNYNENNNKANALS